jgi:hypothetical protein
MQRANKANAAVKAYHERLSWGKREVTIDVEGVPRRLDIADVKRQRGVEHKTGYQGLTAANQWEIARDEILVKRGWNIYWYFEGRASKRLIKALDDAGIGCVYAPGVPCPSDDKPGSGGGGSSE